MHYMRIYMDADCLIKLTKAGLKELIVKNYEVLIPSVVELEVVQAGLAKGLADARVVQENITQGLVSVFKNAGFKDKDGDMALTESFTESKCQAVATDDRKLVRILKSQSIPFVLPAVMLYNLCKSGRIKIDEGKKYLKKLKPFISPDELNAVKILLEAL